MFKIRFPIAISRKKNINDKEKTKDKKKTRGCCAGKLKAIYSVVRQ